VSDNDNKIIGLKLTLFECSHGSLHVTNVEPIREDAVVYEASDADSVIDESTSSGIRWSRAYNANWEANFGDKPETEAN
jgi:hypothetical protein